MKIRFKKLRQSKIKRERRLNRHRRVRSKISGTTDVPRMSFFRSNKNNYVQIIDDSKGETIVSASDNELKSKGKKSEKAKALGELIAKKALDKKITKVVFDRGGYQYLGRVKVFAEAARSAGLKF